MTIYSIILSSLSLAFIISIIIICKKPPLLACLLMVINIMFILIKLVDPTYYNELASDNLTVDDLDKILFAYSFILFVLCLCLFLVKILIKLRKVNCRVDNTPIFSNYKELSLDNNQYKDLENEFINSNGPMLIIDKNVRINKALQGLLNKSNDFLSMEELSSIVNEKDKDSFNHGSYFRLNVGMQTDWFEKVVYSYRNDLFSVIKRVDEKSYSFFTIGEASELEVKIKELNKKKKNIYGLLLIKVAHVFEEINNTYLEVNENTTRIMIFCKYLMSIRDFFKPEFIEVYKLSNEEFGFVINNELSLDFLINKINGYDSALSAFYYFLSEKKYVIKTKTVIGKYCVKDKESDNVLDIMVKEMNRIISENKDSCVIEKLNDFTSDNTIIENDINVDIKNEMKEKE